MFDFLHYLIYRFYNSYNEKGAASTSAGIVGGFQTINVLTLIMLFQILSQEKRHISKPLILVLFILLQVATYYKYIYKNIHSVEAVEKKWLSKTDLSRIQISTGLYLYAGLSIIIFFGLAIYIGSRT